jgi:hypothetical protein
VDHDELAQLEANFFALIYVLTEEVKQLAALVAELTAISSEDARGVTIADSEYALVAQKLLAMQGRLSNLIADLSPETGTEED